MAFWLFKSEPDVFGINHLERKPKQTEHWDGVRNYQVRNMLRDEIQVGDKGIFYHSSCPVPGIAGIIEVVKAGYPDGSARNPESKYYDPKATDDNPRWFMVDVKLVKKFPRIISLSELKEDQRLENMQILRRGNRLSITPVTDKEWKIILGLV